MVFPGDLLQLKVRSLFNPIAYKKPLTPQEDLISKGLGGIKVGCRSVIVISVDRMKVGGEKLGFGTFVLANKDLQISVG